jgi:glucose-6-phosphate dehydrogenase assembly protein OpcA
MSVDTSLEWAGTPVEVGQIDEALRAAWREEAARAPEVSGALAARTNVLNLIVRAGSREELAEVATSIDALGIHHPSRTLLLLAEPAGPEATLEARINTNVQTLGDRRLLFEQVTIVASGEAARHLPGVVDPLLIPELPDFLWWLGEPHFGDIGFTRMVEIVDRLIVDTAGFDDIETGLRELAEMTIVPHGVAISDFAWNRLRPWRELVAQFFDPPEYAPSLDTIETIEISYEPEGGKHSSGFGEGLLALGWTCSRLGWQIARHPEALAPGSFRWHLVSGERTLTATLSPNHQEDPIIGLRAITMVAGERHPGTFQVLRESGAHLVTRVDVPGAPNLDQIMRATEPAENDLLLHALGQFGSDRTYNGALVFAAQLASGVGGRPR